jgi:hypothetical protein
MPLANARFGQSYQTPMQQQQTARPMAPPPQMNQGLLALGQRMLPMGQPHRMPVSPFGGLFGGSRGAFGGFPIGRMFGGWR